ncbi:MAG: permease-like cell division protein FtsX [Oscillospiraceae bacterium]|nr:permease-like cell division protein FtsX [Oscillospiraceae bacterium]
MKHNFGYFIREGARNMFSHGFMSFAAIGVTVACLLIMGTFALIAFNVNENLAELQRENALVAFVDDTLRDSHAQALQENLEKVDNVSECIFVSREEARDNYVEKYDEDDLYADLSADVFRHRYVIHLEDPSLMQETKAAVENVDGIAKVRGDEAVSNGFITLRNVASLISVALVAVLLVVSLFIISNTIKLTTFDRREEIAIMKMVGATNGFIRWPFVFEGLLLGVLGAVVAFLLQWVLYMAMCRGIAASDTLQLLRVVSFNRIWEVVAVVFGAAGVLIGVGGSTMAIRRFLKV